MTDEPDAPEPVQLPTKTINPDDDLDDRLTSNVTAQIGPSRYFAKDDTGQPVEDWDGVFERVAQNVAIAEAVFHDVPISLGRSVLSDWVDEDTIDEFFGDSEYAELSEEIAPYVDYDNLVDLLEGAPEDIHDRTVETKNEFESMMREQRFMPNSPTLMNAGRELQQLSACISGDTPIYTRTGLKRMDEITVGDEVLTHKGRFKEVTAHWSNGVKDTLDVKRGGKGDNYSVTATPDHEFLTDDGWAELQDTDSAVQPVALPDTETPDTFDLTKYTSVMNKDKPVVSDGGVVKVQNGDDPRTGAYDKQYSEVVAEVENTESFAYLAGAFLAEGDVDGSDVRFTIGSDEDEFEDDIVSALEDAFDVHVAVMESSYGQWKTITASSPFIADLFRTVFGTGVTEKTVPEWVFASDKAYQQSLLDGLLDGDGHELESGWELTLANPTLCYEATLMARNLGHDVSFTLEAENELSANPTSRAYISKKGGRTALKHIDTTSGSTQEVYDMEVADDHSFVAGDFVVHNCFVVEPGDAMTGQAPDGRASIMSAAEQAAGVFKSGGGVGYPFHLLRPKGARIESTDGVSSGPLSFMEIFDTTCGTVEQGGKRRGAQMGIMHVQHPDIGRFCVSKRGEDTLTNFNISAGISDEFREAVKKDETVRFIDPETGFPNPDTFEVVAETAHFYDPEFADSWNDQFDKPGVGYDGKQVEENFWRDYLEYMADPEAFEQYRDQISLEPGEPMELPAGFVWQLMVDGAYNNGEPGFVYLDEINEHHSVDVEENPEDIIHATNPCAEQPLSNYEACNLGHVNLSLMVDEDAEPFDQWLDGQLPDFDDFADGEHVRDYLEHALDTDQLAMTARNGARFLDNVVTMSKFPLEEIEEVVHSQRKIGLGLMGFHQMLLQMGVEYGSSRSYKVAREIMRIIDEHATEESRLLAEERGVYGNWADSKYADPEQYPDWIEQHAHVDVDDVDGPIKIRNHKQTTIAPTGTTSMIGNTTGGCEPLYNVAYFKNVGDDIQGDEMLVEFDDYFLDTLEANGISPDAVREEATELMMDNQFDGVDDLDTVPDNIARLFVTTEDLSVEQHIRVQAAFQEYCSSSISKTLNMANDVSLDDVSDAIDLALQLGIKGATIYRVNSRSEEVKTTSVTGGGVTVPEADADTLVDELTGRLDADELDAETRNALVDAIDVDDTSGVAVDDAPVSLSQD